MFQDVAIKHGPAPVLASVRPINRPIRSNDDGDLLIALLDGDVRFVLGALSRVGWQVDPRVDLPLLFSVRLELLYELVSRAR